MVSLAHIVINHVLTVVERLNVISLLVPVLENVKMDIMDSSVISHVLQTVYLTPVIAPQVNVSGDAIDTFMVICVISLVVKIV